VVVSNIFRTDAVKIIKLTIRPISRHHPQSSSLPHIDTGPTVSFIFGTLPGSPFLLVSSTLRFGLDLLSDIKPASFQLQFYFGNMKKSQGTKPGEYGEWGMTAILFFARNCWMRKEV
jgi:hypothetical protein